MSRILDDDQFIERLVYWTNERLKFIRRKEKFHYTDDEWDDIRAECYYKLAKLKSKIREFSLNKPYPASVVGYVNNIVDWTITEYEDRNRADKRVIHRKATCFEDLRIAIANKYRGMYDLDNCDPLDFFTKLSKNSEDELIEALTIIPKVRKMMVWVGGLDVFEYWMYGTGEAPTREHEYEVKVRMRKHWFEEMKK